MPNPDHLTHYPMESPAIGHALQLVLADVLECQSAPGDEVLDCLRYKDFGGAGQTAHPGSDVDGDASDLAVDDIALAGVDSRADLDPKWPYRIDDCPGAADRPGWTVERSEEPITCSVHFLPPVAGQESPHRGVMAPDQVTPTPAAQIGGFRR